MQLDLPPAVSASVDWLSGSVRSTDKRLAAERLFNAIASRATQDGAKEQLAAWKGYQLRRVGTLSWGRRHDDDYIECRSTGAAEWWLSFLPMLHHVARLDLAITWHPPTHRYDLAKSLYRTVSARNDRGHSPPQLRYFETFAAGQTFYVGSSKSDQLARIYDKGVEMGVLEPGELWRYEVQFRNDAAAASAGVVAKSDSQGRAIAGIVATWLKRRLVACDWANGLDDVPIVIHRPKSTDEIRKRWLSATVRPVILDLGQRCTRAELEAILGFGGLDR